MLSSNYSLEVILWVVVLWYGSLRIVVSTNRRAEDTDGSGGSESGVLGP